MFLSSSYPHAIALIMAFFHLAPLLTCYVENMQYHLVKDRQNPLELSELELELKRFTKYRDITRKLKNALVQPSSENTKLKGGLFLLLVELKCIYDTVCFLYVAYTDTVQFPFFMWPTLIQCSFLSLCGLHWYSPVSILYVAYTETVQFPFFMWSTLIQSSFHSLCGLH